MSNCHDLFDNFHEKIYLHSDSKKTLRKSRNAIRNKIIKHFNEVLKISQPKFYGQGSYMMNTTVTPIDGEYDIDDGIYLQHLNGVTEKDWPTPTKVHNWIVDAVDGHTTTPPVDKNTCVRVIYKSEYHVDLPIYVMSGDHPKLSHKSKGWIDSDPKLLTDWFNGKASERGEQLKRIVRYFKAWKDFKDGDPKLPSGMILTILAENYFVADDNDDASLAATAKSIHDNLSSVFSLIRPVFPSEELISDWSTTRQDNFLTKLNYLIKKAAEALETEDKTTASQKWIKVFGSRFPEYDPPEEESTASKSAAPAVLGNHGRSA
jgi:hypothetical protein